MRRLPFTTGSFAGAWVCASLVHVPEPAVGDCLAELFRTLRPGGAVAISMKAGTDRGWRPAGEGRGQRWFTFVRPDAFETLMADHGFVDVATASSGRGSWFVARGARPQSVAESQSSGS